MKKFSSKGFSLVELLIVLLISTILLLASLALLLDFINTRKSAHYHQEMLRNTELVFSFLTEDLHNAKTVDFENQQLKIVTFGDETVTYQIDPGSQRISRANQIITSDELKVVGFDIKILRDNRPLPLVIINFDIGANFDKDFIFKRQTAISLRTNRTDLL